MWYEQLIDEMREHHIADSDDATRGFIRCFAGATNEVAAWESYEALAEESQWDGAYSILTFRDGSTYSDAEQGVNRFAPAEA